MNKYAHLDAVVVGGSNSNVQEVPEAPQQIPNTMTNRLLKSAVTSWPLNTQGGQQFLQNANGGTVNAILGSGDTLHNWIANAANAAPGVPGQNLPMAKSGEGLAYDLGGIGTNVAAFGGGGELLNAGRGLAEGLPMIGNLMKAL